MSELVYIIYNNYKYYKYINLQLLKSVNLLKL